MRRVCWLIAMVAGAASIGTLPARAAGVTSAHCTFSFREHFTPGFTLSPTSGTEGSGGETGTITCTGTFDGHQVTGPGTLGAQGTFTRITCLFDGAPFDGRYSATMPTDAGPLHILGSVRDHRIGLVDFVEGTGPGAVFHGLLALVPTQGTCILGPVTEALILGDITFTPSADSTTAGGSATQPAAERSSAAPLFVARATPRRPSPSRPRRTPSRSHDGQAKFRRGW